MPDEYRSDLRQSGIIWDAMGYPGRGWGWSENQVRCAKEEQRFSPECALLSRVPYLMEP